MCDFLIREMGNPNKSNRYTVQCVLPNNLFNQQIFIFIWFWYIFLLVWNIAGLVKWFFRSLSYKSDKWIERRIRLFNSRLKDDSPKLRHFLDTYLEPDGFFMIRMIGNNSNDFVASKLIRELWKKNYDKRREKYADEPQDDDGIDLPVDRSFPTVTSQRQKDIDRNSDDFEMERAMRPSRGYNKNDEHFNREHQQQTSLIDDSNESENKMVRKREHSAFTKV